AARHRPGPARILPLRFRRQPITRQAQVVRLQLHHLALRVRLVTPLVFGNPFLLSQPVAVPRRLVPPHTPDRAGRVGVTPHLVVGELGQEPQELLLGHGLGGQSKRPTDPLLVLYLIGPSVRLGGRRSHHKLHRTRDHHHRLPLTGDVPLRLRLRPFLPQLPLDAFQPFLPLRFVLRPGRVRLLEPSFLLPLPQQPFRRRTQPRIARRPIQV